MADTERILYLNHQDVKLLGDEIDSVAVIRDAFKAHIAGQTVLPEEAYLGWANSDGETVRSLALPGYLGGPFGTAGTKIINGNISNPRRGLPRASGLTLVYDDASVRVNCIMEGAYLSSLRTACVSALSAELLANPDCEHLAVIGAGVLGRAHVELLVKRFPRLRVLHLFDIDPQRVPAWMQAIAGLLQEHMVDVQIAASAEAAIRAAQLIVTTTTVTTGYIPFAWLQPGSLLINVSLDDPLPEVVLNAGLVVVDDWNLVRADHRRLIGRMYREGLVVGPDEPVDLSRARRIDAQLGELVSGLKPGRRHSDEVILVNPFGLAIEDIALAGHIYRQALALGMGIWLER